MTQLAQFPREPMVRYSKRYISDSQFAGQALAGDLIGITAEDEGVYVEEATAEVYSRDHRFETDSVYIATHLVPEQGLYPEVEITLTHPEDESLDEATTTFESEQALAEYVGDLADEHGPWKALSERGWELVEEYDLREIDQRAL